ncbi:acyltransferase family protein [Thiomicrorhabdus sp.]|uniref:acyltransferase family protein n=1 Tax=Thiomicrorhabdus sp. TaxID=2039724 RepID=UPI0029C779C7|nr:acyltransferase family protein [Thiomicrorhabdus sp.]
MNHLPSPINYREDINGLRSWAVMAVVFFHFGLFGVNGGFVGVDIFFVISGYLMTAIILNGLKQERFSIWKFYLSRIRRILPALLVLVVVLTLLGWFWLPTLDYQQLSKQALSAVSFWSNMYFWKTAGYFDVQAHEKWLLHTWSLSVEFQFYILYPVFLVLVWRITRDLKVLTFVLLTLFLLSFSLNVFLTSFKPVVAFYFLPTRGWELLAGSLVYLLEARRGFLVGDRKKLYVLGWLLVLSSMFFISSEFSWPGTLAIIPVLGASLIIFANQKSKMTTSFVAQWLGDRSYSIYLWHWPLVVAMFFLGVEDDNVLLVVGVFLSLLLGAVSYQFVEIPTRKYLSGRTFNKEIIVIFSATAFLLLASYWLQASDFKNRMPQEVEDLSSASEDFYPKRAQCSVPPDSYEFSPGCKEGSGELGLILVGDSHSVATFSAIGEAASQKNKSVMLWAKSDCSILETSNNSAVRSSCQSFNDRLLEKLDTSFYEIPLLIINRSNTDRWEGRWKTKFNRLLTRFEESQEGYNSEFVKSFNESYVTNICRIAKHRPVYLQRPYPFFDTPVPQKLSRELLFFGKVNDVKESVMEYLSFNRIEFDAQDLAVKQCGAKILDPTPLLCDSENCFGSVEGIPVYRDHEHLSETGNKKLVEMYREKLFSE